VQQISVPQHVPSSIGARQIFRYSSNRRYAYDSAATEEFRRTSNSKGWKKPDDYTWDHQTIDPKTGKGRMISVSTANAGFPQGGIGASVEAIGKDVSMQEEI
jgi:hypothetical protein